MWTVQEKRAEVLERKAWMDECEERGYEVPAADMLQALDIIEAADALAARITVGISCDNVDDATDLHWLWEAYRKARGA